MFCTNCGTQLKEGAKFCTNCGTPVRIGTLNVDETASAETEVAKVAEPEAERSEAPVTEAVSPYAQTVQVSPEAQGTAPIQGQGTLQQPVAPQPIPVQASTAQIQNPAPKKKNLGLILGLSIGIPVFVIALIIIIIVASYNSLKNSYNDGYDDINNPYIVDGPIGGFNVEEPEPDILPEDAAKRTLMIYMVGSDLETETDEYYGGAATDDIYEMCMASLPEDVNIVLECGGAYTWQHPDIPDGEVTRFKISGGELETLQNLGRTTMTRQGDLADFIEFGKEYFPAESYTLILWDHGGGIPVGFGCDELGDYDDSLCDYEIRNELQSAGVKFDSVIFDACNMCTLEIALALDGYADYMVGAESYVNGIGIYYTNWLSKLDGDAEDFCENIVIDYMDEVKENGMVGSMSVIRLDMMEEVYSAYIDYIREAKANMNEGDYAGYYQARGNCGYYEENDSVDLITLATNYSNDYSSPLINSVVNSVVYTESDFAYGHGLMAYSPYDAYYMYDDGRQSFIELGYDNEILEFYDGFISRRLAYLGEEYINDYAGSWYVADFDDEVADSADAALSYEVSTLEGDDYYYVEISDGLWDNLYNVSLAVMIESDDEYFVLGQDYQSKIDSNNAFALVDPEAWVFINGEITTFYCIDYYADDETEEWSQIGYTPVLVNGEECVLYIYYDNDNPQGTIMGYCTYDFETDEESDDMYTLNSDDTVDLVYTYMDTDFEPYYEAAENPFNASDIELSYEAISLDEFSTIGYYEFQDVYENYYTSDIVYLGSISSVQ
ncbi:MAG: zinc-ribbon domain-containing protein [Lachnospiraceae bacterium]|nr:zinc-ribbon domain-containing protein [Lachnospiraceae bacterium]